MIEHPPTIYPLISAYLDELSRLLVDIDPVDRVEVMDGVREHIDAALTGTARTESDVRAALAEVGPARAVADEAYAGRPQANRPLPWVPAPRVPATSRAWLPIVAAVVHGLTILIALLAAVAFTGTPSATSSSTLSASYVTSTDGTVRDSSPVPAPVTVTESHYEGSIWTGLGPFFVALPLWLIVVILVALSALWVGREKFTLIAILPACALSFAVLPELGDLFGSAGIGQLLAVALSVLGSGVLIWVLTRRALHRAAALTSPGAIA